MQPNAHIAESPYRLSSHRRVINLSSEDFALFHTPDPKRESSVQGEVNKDGPEGPIFGLIPPQLIIGVKGDGSNSYSRVAKR